MEVDTISTKRPGLFGSGLSGWEVAAVLGVTVLFFLFRGGPLWKAPAQEAHIHRILDSYLLVVPAVAALLAARRRFSLLSLVSGTLLIWSFKLLITASLWIAIAPGTASRYSPRPVEALSRRRPARHRHAREGHSGGREVVLFVTDGGFAKERVRVTEGDRIVPENGGDRLHTLHLYTKGKALQNMPLPPASRGADLTFPTAGAYEIRCDVHPEERVKIEVTPRIERTP